MEHEGFWMLVGTAGASLAGLTFVGLSVFQGGASSLRQKGETLGLHGPLGEPLLIRAVLGLALLLSPLGMAAGVLAGDRTFPLVGFQMALVLGVLLIWLGIVRRGRRDHSAPVAGTRCVPDLVSTVTLILVPSVLVCGEAWGLPKGGLLTESAVLVSVLGGVGLAVWTLLLPDWHRTFFLKSEKLAANLAKDRQNLERAVTSELESRLTPEVRLRTKSFRELVQKLEMTTDPVSLSSVEDYGRERDAIWPKLEAALRQIRTPKGQLVEKTDSNIDESSAPLESGLHS